MKTANIYSYPLNEELVSRVVMDNVSHTGPWKGSVDFAVPLGTEVVAALDGKVTRVRDDSDKYSDNPASGNDVNYITIEHANSELSEYLHLAKNSTLVIVGQTVKSGQPIAETGLSGWLFAPHLHFMVYKQTSKPADFHCLDVKFQ